jgi:predicted metal-dependent phosphotriesterase family hydrolase
MLSPAVGKIRTVLGAIEPRELGNINTHEYLLIRSSHLRTEELDDLEFSCTRATEMQRAGIDALVELTLIGLSRDSEGFAEISKRSGWRVVLVIGIRREAQITPERWIEVDESRDASRSMERRCEHLETSLSRREVNVAAASEVL